MWDWQEKVETGNVNFIHLEGMRAMITKEVTFGLGLQE